MRGVDDFGLDPLPGWVQADERWERQVQVTEEIVEAFKSVDVVFLQAPTGTGKTLIAELVGRELNKNSKYSKQMLYSCTTKALQDQFAESFPYAKVIKGKSNYLTDSGVLDEFGNNKKKLPSDVTCADCTWTPDEAKCRWCGDKSCCPYNLARVNAQLAKVASVNTAYLLTDLGKGAKNFAGRELMVLDECHKLEGEILSQQEVVISAARIAKLGLSVPKHKTVEKSWIEWIGKEAIPTIQEYLLHISSPNSGIGVRGIREYKSMVELIEKLDVLRVEIPEGGWVYDGYSKYGSPTDTIIFRPVRVSKWGKELLWPHARKFLLMSATILSADLLAEELGLSKAWQLIDVPSSFPIENRPINIVSVADMSYAAREATGGGNWADMIKGIEGVANLHPDDRILIHTVSYDLARYVHHNVSLPGRNVVGYWDSYGKTAALEDYKNTPKSILVAASMDHGVDLPHDLCRVQIIVKVPFLNMKDKRIAKRLHGGQGGKNWYRMQAIRTLIQMCGRGVRSSDDWAITYILDSQFLDNLWKSEYLFPGWWKEAINWRFNKRALKLEGSRYFY